MKKLKPIVKLMSGVCAASVCLALFSCGCPDSEPCYHPLGLREYLEASRYWESVYQEKYGTATTTTTKKETTLPFTYETSRRHHPQVANPNETQELEK